MKHLQFMARFLMIEQGDGYADLSDRKIEDFINDCKVPNGIGDESFENETEAVAVLKTLRVFYDIFKSDPMIDASNGIKELRVEYFIISMYLLVRHVSKYYVVNDETANTIRNFIYYFHQRWSTFEDSEDTDLLTFSNSRQQGVKDLQTRDIILRQVFFDYLKNEGLEVLEKDKKRAFSELDRISIYRKGKGFCQECLRQGKPELEARVSWSGFQADHVIPHAKGGKTCLENGELLCSYHNQSKGASMGANT